MVEWERLTLKEAGVELLDCVHNTPPAAEHGIPYVAIPQMKQGAIDFSDARRISYEHFKEWTKKAAPKAHDMVLSRRCNPGETAYVRPGLEFALGQNLVLLRADGRRVRPHYLRWMVRSSSWWAEVEKFRNVGAVFDSLRCADVPKFLLPVPPLCEQDRISSILGVLDDNIELNQRMNVTLEAMARLIFKDWFVDFGPTRAKAEGRSAYLASDLWSLFPDTLENGRPTTWGNAKLADIAEVIMGASPDGATYNSDGIGVPLVNGPVEFGEYFILKTKWTSAPTRMSKNGDLIVCVRGSTTGRHAHADGEYCLGRGVCAIRARSALNGFVERQVLDRMAELLTKTTGSVFPNLAADDIKSFPVLLPAEAVLKRFEALVEPLRARIRANVRESGTLLKTRDLLLPKLTSGEIRVRDSERAVEAAA